MDEMQNDLKDPSDYDGLWAARAAFYGLSPEVAPREPTIIADGECIRLTPSFKGGGRFDDRLQRVPVHSVRDLKRLIGTPDEVIRLHGCGCDDLPAESVPVNFKSLDELDAEQHKALYTASRAFLHGDSTRVAHFESPLNRAFELDQRRFVGVLWLQDLIVERNATVTLGGAANVALFRRIIIKRNGRLRLERSIKIDCVSIEGEGFLNSKIFPRDSIANAVRDSIR
jgi:hypothetical protein